MLLSPKAILKILISSINPLKAPEFDFPTNKPVVPFVTEYPGVIVKGVLAIIEPPKYIFKVVPSYKPVREIH